ncbi:MAG: glycolate oxidase subunit GlcE [Gammaproteobacteria bacterium]|nr:glycolate oxidase subunit GlcE [Gammaproteobacteria bacterium]
MTSQDITQELQARVASALQNNTPLCIQGGGSKSFYGRLPTGDILDTSKHSGIINYEPSELVITARAGTPLSVIETALVEHHQILPFDPPHFSDTATIGGTIACNLSGPRRAYTGAARDFVLGCKIINGKGEVISFGGEVMKNVAGYDVSRLMTGALGTLGVLLEVSLKVIPKTASEITLTVEHELARSLNKIHRLANIDLPISASCYDGIHSYLRLSGSEGAVRYAQQVIGGNELSSADSFWQKIKEHQHGFFNSDKPLWRLSVASDTQPIDITGKWFYEWGGALRWLISDAPVNVVQGAAQSAGGHATLYRGTDAMRNDCFQPLSPALYTLHKKLKHAFDPQGIFNPGRMYADF